MLHNYFETSQNKLDIFLLENNNGLCQWLGCNSLPCLSYEREEQWNATMRGLISQPAKPLAPRGNMQWLEEENLLAD